MARQAPCLMVQGTGSGVGKSLLTAALCRLFARAGYRVTPFKAQNMALNAAVADGGEIGRAQAAQAEAAGVEPTVDMNPILLKPEGDLRSQVVVRGAAAVTVDFERYQAMTASLVDVVAASLARLRAAYDLVLIEGAGSPRRRDGRGWACAAAFRCSARASTIRTGWKVSRAASTGSACCRCRRRSPARSGRCACTRASSPSAGCSPARSVTTSPRTRS